jgi:ribosomal protein S18 acetylase RimI-like enzyme
MNLPHTIIELLEADSIVGFKADGSDIPAIESLILGHGPNDWNYLPKDAIHEHLAKIATGSTLAILAFSKPKQLTVGAVTYEIGSYYPQYQEADRMEVPHGYIAEAVVHADFIGRGIGSMLLGSVIEDLAGSGIEEVYAMRHSDNDPSRRMMEKAGMVMVDEFDDPDIRTTGSRRTAVMRFSVES